MAELYLICRDIDGERYTLCWNKVKSEAAWISEERYSQVREHFGKVAYYDRNVAEDRAKQMGWRGINFYVLPINQDDL